MRHVRVLGITLALLLALSACGGGESSDQPSAGGMGTLPAGEQTGAEAASSPAQEAAGASAASAEEDLTLSNVTGGLASLSSYKSRFAMGFAGTDAQGQEVDNTWTMEEDVIQEPHAQRTAMTSTESVGGQAGQPGSFEIFTIGEVTYWVSHDADGTVSCTSMSSSEPAAPQQGIFTPDMLGGISDAKYVGTETVNGVRTKHYAWQENTMPLFGFGSVKGDVWVAADGEYTVKYRAEATGKGSFLSTTDAEGTLTVEYDLTDINGSFAIEAPSECQGPATDIPVMADAQDKATFGDTISYSSPSALTDVVAFYQTEMPQAGWQASGEPSNMEGFAMLEFTKEVRTAQLMLTYDTDAQTTSVIISLSQQE
jgi:hypothetical protein